MFGRLFYFISLHNYTFRPPNSCTFSLTKFLFSSLLHVHLLSVRITVRSHVVRVILSFNLYTVTGSFISELEWRTWALLTSGYTGMLMRTPTLRSGGLKLSIYLRRCDFAYIVNTTTVTSARNYL